LALCLDEEACLKLCAEVDDCYGVDMHVTLPRCFLNTISCRDHVFSAAGARLHHDIKYEFFYKRDAAPATRRLLEVEDLGYSWNRVLRYKGLNLRSGGTFKVCFCDEDLLPLGQSCSTQADYKVELGTIHASGVSCLLGDTRFHRGTCCPQFWGGHRCYATGSCPALSPPAVAPAAGRRLAVHSGASCVNSTLA